MKVLIIFLILTSRVYSCEYNEGTFSIENGELSDVLASLADISAMSLDEFYLEDVNDNIPIIVTFSDSSEAIVMGMSAKKALELSGSQDEGDYPCNKNHGGGDISNRWCHAIIVKTIRQELENYDVPSLLAGAMAATIFIPKEYYFDRGPSPSDLVINFPIVQSDSVDFDISIFGDSYVAIGFSRSW